MNEKRTGMNTQAPECVDVAGRGTMLHGVVVHRADGVTISLDDGYDYELSVSDYQWFVGKRVKRVDDLRAVSSVRPTEETLVDRVAQTIADAGSTFIPSANELASFLQEYVLGDYVEAFDGDLAESLGGEPALDRVTNGIKALVRLLGGVAE